MPHLKEFTQEINIRGIKARTLVDHDEILIKTLYLDPFKSIEPHKVPVLVTFIVLEGQGEISIGDLTYEVSKNHVIECPKNTLMALQASKEGLVFLNIKSPGFKVIK